MDELRPSGSALWRLWSHSAVLCAARARSDTSLYRWPQLPREGGLGAEGRARSDCLAHGLSVSFQSACTLADADGDDEVKAFDDSWHETARGVAHRSELTARQERESGRRVDQPPRSDSATCGAWLAWTNTDVPACKSTCERASFEVSEATSTSRIALFAASRLPRIVCELPTA